MTTRTPPDLPLTDYAELRPHLRPGDVAYFHADTRSVRQKLANFTSWRFQRAQPGWANHVGLLDVEGYFAKRVVIIEVQGGGVRINPLSMYLGAGCAWPEPGIPREARAPYPGRVYIGRPDYLHEDIIHRLSAFDLMGGLHEQAAERRPAGGEAGPKTYELNTDVKRQQIARARAEYAIRDQNEALLKKLFDNAMRAADSARQEWLAGKASKRRPSCSELVGQALAAGGVFAPVRNSRTHKPCDILEVAPAQWRIK